MKRTGMSHLGDPFPIVSVTAFERGCGFPTNDVWPIVGPTIARNYRSASQQELYCIAFIEGMRMALAAMKGDPA